MRVKFSLNLDLKDYKKPEIAATKTKQLCTNANKGSDTSCRLKIRRVKQSINAMQKKLIES